MGVFRPELVEDIIDGDIFAQMEKADLEDEQLKARIAKKASLDSSLKSAASKQAV